MPQPLQDIRNTVKGNEQPYHRGRPGMESISTTSRIHISIDSILNTVRLVLLRRTSGEENRIPSIASSRSIMDPGNQTRKYTKDREHGKMGIEERRSSHVT